MSITCPIVSQIILYIDAKDSKGLSEYLTKNKTLSKNFEIIHDKEMSIFLSDSFGKIPSWVYEIFFQTRQLDNWVNFYQAGIKGSTSNIVLNMFENYTGKILTPQSEYEENILSTIKVLFKYISDLANFSWVIWSRAFANDPRNKRIWDKSLPTFICGNLISSIIQSNSPLVSKLSQMVILELLHNGVPMPDNIGHWHSDNDYDSDNYDYTSHMVIYTPYESFVGTGWTFLLEKLLEKEDHAEQVKSTLCNCEKHVQRFRNEFTLFKKEYSTQKIDDNGKLVPCGQSNYEKYYPNGDELIAKLEAFVQTFSN